MRVRNGTIIGVVAGVVALAIVALRRLWAFGATLRAHARAARRRSDPRAAYRVHARDLVHAPPDAIWPWLVQIGWQRAGWYSYDLLERLVGAADFVDGPHSARRIVPELQTLAPGDAIRLGPEPMPAFTVMEVDPPRALVLGGTEGVEGTGASWAFALEPLGDSTRLIARFRLTYPPTPANHLMWGVSELAHMIMEQKMLRGIRRRAEASVWRWQREE